MRNASTIVYRYEWNYDENPHSSTTRWWENPIAVHMYILTKKLTARLLASFLPST